MFVPGYEHHTWRCDGCGEAERRMTFIPKKEVWMRATERVRSKQAELREREDIARATERLARGSIGTGGGSASLPAQPTPLGKSPTLHPCDVLGSRFRDRMMPSHRRAVSP